MKCPLIVGERPAWTVSGGQKVKPGFKIEEPIQKYFFMTDGTHRWKWPLPSHFSTLAASQTHMLRHGPIPAIWTEYLLTGPVG
jgi:hypothetical protein